ncbi:MAG: phosphoadenosine phosphosulfate reductase family protein, partial [Thaumarchaeota archaeon]|nr:phosphoadenosine phosphosulfate reductase family protein [Candidatus Geocrenenecus arthurdayi]
MVDQTEELRPSYTKEMLDNFDRLRNLPYEEKLKMSHDIIKEALNKFKRVAVACSFGKDSVIVLHMVRQYKPDILVVFSNTGVEMKETLQYRDFLVKEWNLNYIEAKPKMTFWEIVEKYGYPATRFMT